MSNALQSENDSLLFQNKSATAIPYDSSALRVWFILTISVSLFGSVLLVLLLSASCRFRELLLRGSCILIFHSMLIQLLICAVICPILNISSYLTLINNTTLVHCPTLIFFNTASDHTDNWAALFLAVNRFVAIVSPHHYDAWVSRKVLICMIIIPWLIGISDSLPVYFGIGGQTIIGPAGCAFETDVDGFYGTLWFVIGAYIPIGLMGIIYTILFVRIGTANRNRPNLAVPFEPNGQNARLSTTQKRQISIAKMLIGSFAWYCICFLPGPIIVSLFPGVYAVDQMLRLWISGLLGLCGFAGCPIIFLASSADYRTGVKGLFRMI
ncbi:hypothetical protein BV898_13293 [Hypsibius exemplaris]|uniref:G-protein coupled receptors family 1 profile domain-containing protein n=1 Tax=Hypsibius exemplaris TaxID=2072580 RepID=A0A1W0WB72_HYPEX|nr:hypothetical protein BV898_13293 [Hypsibius exemplaris]